MNAKLFITLFLALIVAYSQAGHLIINTHSENSTVEASYATNDPIGCPGTNQRSLEQNSRVTFSMDFSYCHNDTVPTWPADWQVLQFSLDKNCDSEFIVTHILAAPSHDVPSLVVYSPLNLPARTILSCNTTSGYLRAEVCMEIEGVERCLHYNIKPNVCAMDPATGFYGTQSTCFGTVSEDPVASPTTSTTPVAIPAAKSSIASIIYNYIALVSLAALF